VRQANKAGTAQRERTCPLCGASIHPRPYCGGRYLACPVCTVAWTNPPPAVNVDDYVGSHVNNAEVTLSEEPLYRGFAADMARFVQKTPVRPSSGPALDVGCSVGLLVEELLRIGFAAEGVELETHAVELATSRGLRVRQGVVDETYETDKYALVTMSHVLEHIQEPLMALEEIRRILAPGGVLVLSQPRYLGWVPSLQGERWYGWQPEGHYWHFTERALKTALERLGFRVAAVEMNSLHYPLPPLRAVRHPRSGARQLAWWSIAQLGKMLHAGDAVYVAGVAP